MSRPQAAPEVITAPDALADLCQMLAKTPMAGVDTEFMRTDTYYARLCLLQFAVGERTVCVDPLTVDIAPLLDVLYTPKVCKVFHSARQDLELFADARGQPPPNVFDTQIAAALCGFDEQIGYSTLVAALTGYTPAKLHTRTDWARRPLPAEVLHYAEEDVRFLPAIHQTLSQRLRTLGRENWAQEEFTSLVDPARYSNDPIQSHVRITGGRGLPPQAQVILRQLAIWREQTAQRLDRPRGWIAGDALLMAIARKVPEDLEALAAIDSLPPALLRKHGPALLAAVARGIQEPPQALWAPPRPLSADEQALLKQMQGRLRQTAETLGIAPTLIANRREMVAMVMDEDAGRLARGWRREVVGAELQQMCEAAAH